MVAQGTLTVLDATVGVTLSHTPRTTSYHLLPAFPACLGYLVLGRVAELILQFIRAAPRLAQLLSGTNVCFTNCKNAAVVVARPPSALLLQTFA